MDLEQKSRRRSVSGKNRSQSPRKQSFDESILNKGPWNDEAKKTDEIKEELLELIDDLKMRLN